MSRTVLGQNFLRNKKIAEKIVEAAKVDKNDIVLEVGPGKGVLTEILLQKAKKVIAVEKDKELVRYLKDRFVHYKNLSVINADILKFSIFNFQFSNKFKIQNSKFKIVANIPYYITSHFLRKFLQSDFQPSLMALMVQKEVAERIVARDGKESLLSISVKSYGQPKIIAKVSAKNFSPEPKVDSAILLIDNISKNFFSAEGGSASGGKINEQKFFQLLRLGFSHKRKLLKNNLKISPEILQKCKIPALSRAENLSLENWKCLFYKIQGAKQKNPSGLT